MNGLSLTDKIDNRTERNKYFTAMLEYQMLILEKVSSDKQLFQKELRKSFQWLKLQEIDKLREWIVKNYSEKHPKIIQEAFSMVA